MNIRERIRLRLMEIFDLDEITLEHPAEEKFGDFSTNAAMVMWKAKEYANPRAMAEWMVKKISVDAELSELLEKVEVAGPGFVNLYLRGSALVDELEMVKKQGEAYGTNEKMKGRRWVVEHTSPNPNKAMHLGHLRNNLTGMALSNLFVANGVEVVRDAVDNDRGIAIAKLMWGYLKFGRKDKQICEDMDKWIENKGDWVTPEDLGVRPDRLVDDFYVKGSGDFEADKRVEERVRKMVVDWENKDEKTWELWKKVLEYSKKGQEMTLRRLGSRWDKVWHESDHFEQGKEWVEKGLEMGVFKKLPDGAVLTDLERYGVTDTVVRKSDGTALYITQDLALTDLKIKEYGADKLFWVIGPEQSLAMKQMFACCEALGIGNMSRFTHVPYGYVSLKNQGKMSSRQGNVVYIDQLIDEVKENLNEKMKDNELSPEQREETLEKLAVGAVKYSILKIGRTTDTAFDLESSVSFDGDSGPYLNYVYVRCRSILGKTEVSEEMETDNLNDSEMEILRWIYRYPEVVELAANDLSPNLVASYLFELAKRFNGFYAENKIIGGDKEGLRIGVVEATSWVIRNGLELLGIEVVEKM